MDYLLTAYDYFRPGGSIMVLLVLISIWMWGLIFERLSCFRKLEKNDVDRDEAVRLVKGAGRGASAEGVRHPVIRMFLAARTGDSDLDRRLLDYYTMRQRPQLTRFLATIAILAATAPLLGLLGTVTGMVTTFDVISLFGTGNAKALSGGISKALVTTQSGLLVGIPGLFMSRLLARRAQAIERRIAEIVIVLKQVV
jgi:biopolymer transport protein ExbB